MMKSPCYKCPKRKVTKDYNCHSHCKEYQEFVEDRIKYHKYNNGNSAEYIAYARKIIEKKVKRKNEKNRI